MSATAPDDEVGIAVVGAGPAGLMAAETLSTAGLPVTLYERMPRPGRKLLLAGRGGLNLTHSEDRESFLARYGAARDRLAPLLDAFPPTALCDWAHGLGQPTFTGSSGRVFPEALKVSPLLRSWLGRRRQTQPHRPRLRRPLAQLPLPPDLRLALNRTRAPPRRIRPGAAMHLGYCLPAGGPQ